MRLWNLTITAQSPLVFPVRKPDGQFRESVPFVPGSTLYGALGGLKTEQALLRAIRCHNAYPAIPGDRWSRPLPLTAAMPKGAGGHPADTLVDRVCWEYMHPAALIYAPTDYEGRGWESAGGFYAPAHPDDLHKQTRRSVTQRMITRVSINRRRGTAEDQRLYSFQAISEVNRFTRYMWGKNDLEQSDNDVFPTRFLGSAAGPDDADLAPLLENIDQIGGRITTGMGLVAVEAQHATPETAGDVADRIKRMSQRFQKSFKHYQLLHPTGDWQPDGDLFTVNLLSDAILYEEQWRPTIILTADMLREAAGLQTSDLVLLRSFALPGLAGGWNVMWPGAKPTEVSVGSGAVYVFQAPHGLAAGDDERLARLQLDGIGERRSEGYGQVRICDDFHIEEAYALDYEQFLKEHV